MQEKQNGDIVALKEEIKVGDIVILKSDRNEVYEKMTVIDDDFSDSTVVCAWRDKEGDLKQSGFDVKALKKYRGTK